MWEVPEITALSAHIEHHVISGRGQLWSHINSQGWSFTSVQTESLCHFHVLRYSVMKKSEIEFKIQCSHALTVQSSCRKPQWVTGFHLEIFPRGGEIKVRWTLGGHKWHVLLHFTGGSGGPPPGKFWNLDPLRLILTQFRVKIHNQNTCTHSYSMKVAAYLFS